MNSPYNINASLYIKNVLNILSKIDVDRLPINVTITYWLHFDYCGPLRCPIFYDEYGSLIHV